MRTSTKIALARQAYLAVRLWRRLAGLPMEGRFERRGISWELDLKEGIDFSIFLLGRFEPAFARSYSRLLRPGDTVLDLGANVGAHALPFAALTGEGGRVVAVEATAYAYARLCRNLELNPAMKGRVHAHHALLVESADAPGMESIYARWPLDARRPVHPSHCGELEAVGGARRTTLDELVGREHLERVDWIKLDVDGNELTVLRGGLGTLDRHRPRLLVELSPSASAPGEGARFLDMVGLLLARGYRFTRLPSCRALPASPERIASSIPDGASLNALCEPT
ncbi:MAG: FkbM family methyltransferase [Thermoanaerobaculaceae bacterium]